MTEEIVKILTGSFLVGSSKMTTINQHWFLYEASEVMDFGLGEAISKRWQKIFASFFLIYCGLVEVTQIVLHHFKIKQMKFGTLYKHIQIHMKKFPIMGVSYGGFVALQLVQDHSSELQSVIIVDSPGGEF